MNLAIVLGVSKYDLPNNDLPACENDVNLMVDILKGINKFNDFLIINNNQSSYDVKEKISHFIEKYKKEEINELFFYYTGHGDIDKEDYYYLLTDFNPNKKKQTSLENSELDNWIRTLNPKLAIKIVDACFSGVHYIKQNNSIKSLLDKTKEGINNCYFLYSSQNTETSAQDHKLSFFTNSFIRAILEAKGTEIRYKHIVDFITDDFEGNTEQTPYFVTQCSYTESFGTIKPELRQALKEKLNNLNVNGAKEKNNHQSIIELVKKDSERYCSETEMINNIEFIKKYISNYKFKIKDLGDLYDIEVLYLIEYPEELSNSLNILGDWINKNGSDFFAQPTYKSEKYTTFQRVKKNKSYSAISRAFGNIYDEYEDKEITKSRNVISGFKLTQNVPYNNIKIIVKPKFQNLKWFAKYILFVFSKTNINFFHNTGTFKELNWNDKDVILKEQWKQLSVEAKVNKKIETGIEFILNLFEKDILKDITEKFNIESIPQSDENK